MDDIYIYIIYIIYIIYTHIFKIYLIRSVDKNLLSNKKIKTPLLLVTYEAPFHNID